MPNGLPSLPNDAIGGSHFALEFDGIEQFQFQEVSGLTVEREITTLKENGPDGRLILRQLPGPEKPPTITLKRATNVSKAMHDWFEQAADQVGDARRSGSIITYDFAWGEVARWNFEGAFPSKVEVTGLKAGANELSIESVTITCDRFYRVK
jgi:phage tail-like protein